MAELSDMESNVNTQRRSMRLLVIVIGVLNMLAPFIGAVSGPETSLAIPVLLGITVCIAVFSFGFLIVDFLTTRKEMQRESAIDIEDQEE